MKWTVVRAVGCAAFTALLFLTLPTITQATEEEWKDCSLYEGLTERDCEMLTKSGCGTIECLTAWVARGELTKIKNVVRGVMRILNGERLSNVRKPQAADIKGACLECVRCTASCNEDKKSMLEKHIDPNTVDYLYGRCKSDCKSKP